MEIIKIIGFLFLAPLFFILASIVIAAGFYVWATVVFLVTAIPMKLLGLGKYI